MELNCTRRRNIAFFNDTYDMLYNNKKRKYKCIVKKRVKWDYNLQRTTKSANSISSS